MNSKIDLLITKINILFKPFLKNYKLLNNLKYKLKI
jgi:hypothetical protein